MYNLINSEKIDKGLSIVLTFRFFHDIMIRKMKLFDKVDHIEIEPTLGCSQLLRP